MARHHRKPVERLHKPTPINVQALAIDAAEQADRDWLAQNDRTPPAPAPVLSLEDMRDMAEGAAFRRLMDELDHNETPDPLGKTGNREPKSIHDPAPAGRIQFERPRKRKGRDPYAAGTDCELPADLRKARTYTFVNDRNEVTGTVNVNPFGRRLTFATPQFKTGGTASDRFNASRKA